jgi:hypothetical protein
MAKVSGIGGNFYINGYDISGDVGVINNVTDSATLLDVTAIDKGAHERIEGIADGQINFSAFFNDAAGQEHAILSALGSADKRACYATNTALGDPGAGIVGKQGDYAGARGNDGSLVFSVNVQTSDGEGLRWGQMLTAGTRTDTGATNGGAVDGGATAPTTFGAVLFLHVFSFSGTDVTVSVEGSDNGTSGWTALTGGAFTQVTSGPTSERLQLASDATVNRYLRAVTATTGGFSSCAFAVLACRRYA